MNYVDIHCDHTLFVTNKEGTETKVSIYSATELRLNGLAVVKTYPSLIPNRSAVRRVALMEGVEGLEIRVHCHLTGRGRRIRLSS